MYKTNDNLTNQILQNYWKKIKEILFGEVYKTDGLFFDKNPICRLCKKSLISSFAIGKISATYSVGTKNVNLFCDACAYYFGRIEITSYKYDLPFRQEYFLSWE